jgi:hypothetical protein
MMRVENLEREAKRQADFHEAMMERVAAQRKKDEELEAMNETQKKEKMREEAAKIRSWGYKKFP